MFYESTYFRERQRIPEYISFLSITVGVLGLVYSTLAEKFVSVFILILGIASVYIERFTPNIDSYSNRGIANTDQLNKLKNLYFEVKGMPDSADFSTIEARYTSIENEFNASSQPNQIVFANWFAHYKMFCEKDMNWMDEQLHFHWWKDKIPKSAHLVIYSMILVTIAYYCVKVPTLNEFFCKIFYLD